MLVAQEKDEGPKEKEHPSPLCLVSHFVGELIHEGAEAVQTVCHSRPASTQRQGIRHVI